MRRLWQAAIAIGALALPISSALGAGASGTTWVLVNTTCAGSQVEVGQGCYDQGNGTSSAWAVHASSATWTDPTFTVQFTYTVPATVGPSGGAVALAVDAKDISNGSGILGQLCATSTFGISESDPCARGHAVSPGSSDSGSKTLHLSPATDSAGATETVTINVGSGHVVFTYKAQAASSGSGGGTTGTHVSYRFSGQVGMTSSHPVITFFGTGGFILNHIPAADATTAGSSPTGTARIVLYPLGPKTFTTELALVSVRFSKRKDAKVIELTYNVVRSTTNKCGAPGTHIVLRITQGGGADELEFKRVCGKGESGFHHIEADVTISGVK
jgi:hypothetical protein